MIGLAAVLMAAAPVPAAPDCGRYRARDELQQCEFQRDETADILDAADRPPATRLGREAIRFSTRPELGGNAAVVEVVADADGGARARISTFYGHPRIGWEPVETSFFTLGAREYRRLANGVDAELSAYRPVAPRVRGDGSEGEAIIVCTDGPGYLTERVRDGQVETLAGFCPRTRDEEHANRRIADSLMAMVCRHVGDAIEVDLRVRRRCGG